MGSTQTSKKQRSSEGQGNSLIRFFLGTKDPDAYTKVTFYTLLVITGLFLVWNIVGYAALSYQHLIHIHRNVSIDRIFAERATALGYSAEEFSHRLGVLFTMSIVCWLIILGALVLLWRKNTLYFPIIIGSALLYLAMLFFYIGYDYFRTDTSLFDKVALLVLFVMAGLHFFILKKERSGESLSFFGEDD